MASGDTLLILEAANAKLPGSSAAQFTSISGGATPSERDVLLNFDSASVEYADWKGVLPRHYAGGGLTLTLTWLASSATTGGVVWGAAIRRMNDDAEDFDSTAHSYDFNDSGTCTAPSAVGENSYDNITFTSGADMDSLAAGEVFYLRIRRTVSAGGDTMAGDARLSTIEIRET